MWRYLIVLIVAVALVAPTLASPKSGGGGTASSSSRSRAAATSGRSAPTANARGFSSATPTHPPGRPTARGLAFVSSRSGDEEIYVAKADGTDVTRLTKLRGPDLSPAWSSDGRQLSWSRNAEIWTMSASGTDKRRLVAKAQVWHEHHSPAWHRSAIVYSSTRVSAFNTELFRAPAKRLTFTKGSEGVLGDDSMPDFSPGRPPDRLHLEPRPAGARST